MIYSNVIHSIGYNKVILIIQIVEILENRFKIIWGRAMRFQEVGNMVSAVKKLSLYVKGRVYTLETFIRIYYSPYMPEVRSNLSSLQVLWIQGQGKIKED